MKLPTHVPLRLHQWGRFALLPVFSLFVLSACDGPFPQPTLTASPDTVDKGGTSTLTWTSPNAIGCAASGGWSGRIGGWSGSMASSGSKSTGALNTTTTYTLQCYNTRGCSWATATVYVRPSPSTVTLGASSTNSASYSFSCNPATVLGEALLKFEGVARPSGGLAPRACRAARNGSGAVVIRRCAGDA